VIALHDRLIPGTRGNIDHLFVAPTGVWIVDAKAYKGKVVQREVGPLWRRDNEVYVGGRNRTALARGVEHQLTAVLAAVRSDDSLNNVDIYRDESLYPEVPAGERVPHRHRPGRRLGHLPSIEGA
jgi:hypothetical protein